MKARYEEKEKKRIEKIRIKKERKVEKEWR